MLNNTEEAYLTCTLYCSYLDASFYSLSTQYTNLGWLPDGTIDWFETPYPEDVKTLFTDINDDESIEEDVDENDDENIDESDTDDDDDE